MTLSLVMCRGIIDQHSNERLNPKDAWLHKLLTQIHSKMDSHYSESNGWFWPKAVVCLVTHSTAG